MSRRSNCFNLGTVVENNNEDLQDDEDFMPRNYKYNYMDRGVQYRPKIGLSQYERFHNQWHRENKFHPSFQEEKRQALYNTLMENMRTDPRKSKHSMNIPKPEMKNNRSNSPISIGSEDTPSCTCIDKEKFYAAAASCSVHSNFHNSDKYTYIGNNTGAGGLGCVESQNFYSNKNYHEEPIKDQQQTTTSDEEKMFEDVKKTPRTRSAYTCSKESIKTLQQHLIIGNKIVNAEKPVDENGDGDVAKKSTTVAAATLPPTEVIEELTKSKNIILELIDNKLKKLQSTTNVGEVDHKHLPTQKLEHLNEKIQKVQNNLGGLTEEFNVVVGMVQDLTLKRKTKIKN